MKLKRPRLGLVESTLRTAWRSETPGPMGVCGLKSVAMADGEGSPVTACTSPAIEPGESVGLVIEGEVFHEWYFG